MFESFKIALINMVTIVMMLAKAATPGFLKKKGKLNRGYDTTISVDEINNKIKLNCRCGHVTKVW